MESSQITALGLVRLLVGTLMALPTIALATDLAPPEAYSTMSEIRHVAISPSGKLVAYQSIKNDENLILVLDVSSNQLVLSTGVGKSYLRKIQFVSDEFVAVVFDLDPRSPRAARVDSHIMLAKGPGSRFGRRTMFLDLKKGGFQKNYVAQASGDIASVAPDLDAIYIRWDVGSLIEYSIRNGQASVPLAGGSSDTFDWYLNINHEPLVREDFEYDRNQHSIYVYRDGKETVLAKENNLSRDIDVVALSPEQDKLIYFTRRAGVDRMTYHTMSLVDGSRSGPIFSQHIGRVLVDSGNTAFGFERDEFPAYEYEFLNQKAESHFRSISKSLPDMQVRLVASTDDFEHMVVGVRKGWGTAYLMIFSAGVPQPVVIDKVNTAVSTEQSLPRSMLEFSASDGRIIRAYLTMPAGAKSATDAPLIVLSNGSHFAYQTRGYQWLAQYLASRGFVVVQPGIRGGDYSWNFMPGNDLSWGGKLESDINDTVQHLADEGITKATRVCVIGFDMGGYAALLAAARSPEKYRCVASISGLSELDVIHERAWDRRDRHPQNLRYLEVLFGITGNDKAALKDKSPLTHVDIDFPPALLMYYQRGDTMLADSATIMRRDLRRKGRDVTLVELPGYDFVLSEREARPKILKAISEFVEEHL